MNDPTLQQARRRLLRWYRKTRRDLPWRGTKDPYCIWISEIMLQQTRVDVVVPRYERFLRRFPTLRALAAARLDDVLQEWSGLGYYSRARNLHAAARRVVSDHDGHLPSEVSQLRALPGIGPYSAGAIASIAFGRPEPILDGNVKRLFSRLLAWEEEVETASTRRHFWDLARRWARSRVAADVNQGLMELGATLCAPGTPECSRCPLRSLCRAHRLGRQAEFPRSRRRPPVRLVRLAAILVRSGPSLLLVRRRSGRLLRDWWEIPTTRLEKAVNGNTTPRRALQQRAGFDSGSLRRLTLSGPLRHGILSNRIDIEIFQAQLNRRPRLPARTKTVATHTGTSPLANLDLQDLDWRWTSAAESRHLPLSTLARKVLTAAGIASFGSEEGSQRRGKQEAA